MYELVLEVLYKGFIWQDPVFVLGPLVFGNSQTAAELQLFYFCDTSFRSSARKCFVDLERYHDIGLSLQSDILKSFDADGSNRAATLLVVDSFI